MLMLGEKAQWKVIYLEFSLNSFLRRNSLLGNSIERRNLEKYLVNYLKRVNIFIDVNAIIH